MSQPKPAQRIAAEVEFADELDTLARLDQVPPPAGWILSPQAVEKFVLGDEKLGIQKKFVAPPGIVTRVIVAIATGRGSLLMGEPGTAKSRLSELLCAAISRDSSYVVQGGAISDIKQLLYSWNQAMLVSSGPCMEALVPSPIFRAMEEGKLVRFEEISRCPQPIQDAMLTLLSERMISIPELPHGQSLVYAKAGFNIIATANNVDTGLHQMSAALKRRMSFEHISPIKNLDDEIDIVLREVKKLNAKANLAIHMDDAVIEVLTTLFHELRFGQTVDGRSTDRLASSAMSTAEVVSVAHAICVHAHFYCQGQVSMDNLVHFVIGAALKDDPSDKRRLGHYFDSEISGKAGAHWQALFRQRHLLK